MNLMHKLILAGALVYSSISISDTTIYTSDTEGLLNRTRVIDSNTGLLTPINQSQDQSHLPLYWDQDSQMLILKEGYNLVFGGDAVDRGPEDREILSALYTLAKNNPDRVTLILGNRELNKMRWGLQLLKENMNGGQLSVQTLLENSGIRGGNLVTHWTSQYSDEHEKRAQVIDWVTSETFINYLEIAHLAYIDEKTHTYYQHGPYDLCTGQKGLGLEI